MADEGFTRRLVQQILKAGALQVRPLIPSKTLRAALRRITDSPLEGRLFIPHYWAVYVHDGRRGIQAPAGSFLIFFPNPADDPRFPSRQTPERATSVRRLTTSEFRDAVREVRSGSGKVVITRRVRGVRADLFFANEGRGGMVGFVNEANDIGQIEFRTFALRFLRRALDIRGFIPTLGPAGITFRTSKEEAIIRIGR